MILDQFINPAKSPKSPKANSQYRSTFDIDLEQQFPKLKHKFVSKFNCNNIFVAIEKEIPIDLFVKRHSAIYKWRIM